MKIPNTDWEEAILDSLEPGNENGTIGFKPGENQADRAIVDSANDVGVGETAPVTDALSDDLQMKEILAATSAIALLAIKKKLANEALTEIDRRLYYEAIDIKGRELTGAYSIEYAARKEAEEAAKQNAVGFKVGDTTIVVTAEVSDAQHATITDATGETHDICLSMAQPIVDAAGKPSGWYRQPASKVDAINDNLRLYPRPIYEPALAILKKAKFPYVGENPHPKSYRAKTGAVMFESVLENQAVAFRDAYITDDGIVMVEYKPLSEFPKGRMVQALIDAGKPVGLSNRMTGPLVTRKVNNRNVEVPVNLTLYGWDVVMNPGESLAFSAPTPLTDAAIKEICDSLKEDDNQMNFLSMTLNELKQWKTTNAGHKDMAVCDEAIRLKEIAEQSTAVTDELTRYRQAEETRQAEVAAAQLKEAAVQALTDAVNALPYDQKIKDALQKKGEAVITDAVQVVSFIEQEKAFVDSMQVVGKLDNLGFQTQAKTTSVPEVTFGEGAQPWQPIIDKLMLAFDDHLRIKTGVLPDTELRKANKAILDRLLQRMENENHPDFIKHMKSLTDSAQAINDEGAITDSALSATGDFSQASIISSAILQQVWQDLHFLQLVMTEPFSGTTMKVLMEIESADLYSQDDFATGEYEGIETEGTATSTLEFGAEWLKRGTVVSKESVEELKSGPFRYDVLARNLANLTKRLARLTDQKTSTEMLMTSDEYLAKSVVDEVVTVDEIAAIRAGTNAPIGTNAAFVVSLLAGYATTAIGAMVPPVVRPRKKHYIDHTGKKVFTTTNPITVVLGAATLVEGVWDPIAGQIKAKFDPARQTRTTPHYAVDFENALVYFTAASGVDATHRPTISYAYATNVSFFNITVPNGVDRAKYFNRLVEQFDYEKAYMGSAPRYVTPNFALGSLNAMVNITSAELFYNSRLPAGTNLLSGRPYIATRNGVQLGEINSPWAAGDKRLLLGAMNKTRLGVGSPFTIEGPHPHYDANMKITSAKQYFASQQLCITTPLLTDDNGVTFNPPYRTIKLYNG